MTEINLDNLEDFVLGTAILGTGGGGDPYIGKLMLRQELEKCKRIELIDPEDVPDDLFAISVACMGAPTVFVEKVPNTEAAISCLKRAEKELGRTFNAIVPLEGGGVNATLPLVLAARLGLPVVDADGMGRAFPEFQMTTFNFAGVSCTPFIMSDDFGNTVLIDTNEPKRAERYGRPVCVQMGGIAQVASYAMRGEEIRRAAVPRTVTLALEIGRTVREARVEGKQGVAKALIEYFKSSNPPRFSRILFDGKVEDVLRETKDGWIRGRVELISDSGKTMEISFQNEFSRAAIDGKTAAITPDLIMVLDRESGEAITTEMLRYGQRVQVIAVAAVAVMRTPRALEIIGPRAFGIDEDAAFLEDITEIT